MNATNENYNKLTNLLVDYKVNEFNEDPEQAENDLINIKSNQNIAIAYTTLGDNEEFEIQVTLNLRDMRLESVVTGEYVDTVEYYPFKNFDEILYLFEVADFDILIQLEELDIDELIEYQNIKIEENK